MRFEGRHVHVRREGSGEPIIFLHNGGTTHRIWEHQIAHFAQNHEVFALDLPGFGESELPDRDYTLDLCADVLEQLIDEHELRNVTLVGNCMGSATALAYTARHPENVRGVLAINVLTSSTVAPGVLGPLTKLASRWPASRGAVIAASKRLPVPMAVARLSVRMLVVDPVSVDPDTFDHLARRWQDPANSEALFSLRTDTFVQPRRTAAWPPVHVVWGARNKVLPVETAGSVCSVLEAERTTVIENTGHLPMLEQPEQVNDAIEQLLAACAPIGV